MKNLQAFIVEYPHGYQEVDATSKTAARENAGSEPILGVYTRNEWNDKRDRERQAAP